MKNMKKPNFNFSNYALPFYLLFCFLFSIYLFVGCYRQINIPHVSELETLSGTISTVWFSGKRGKKTRFKLNGIDKYFEYRAISGGVIDFQKNALIGTTIELSYSPIKFRSSIFNESKYYVVYSVSFPGRWNRGYQDITRDHKNNAFFLLFLALLFFVFPFWLYFKMKGKFKFW